MIVCAIPPDALKAKGSMTDVECLKFVIFVSAVEDVLRIVFPSQAVVHDILGFGVDDGIVAPTVLHDYGCKLAFRVGHGDVAIVELHGHLLMSAVDVAVGVGGNTEADAHARFYDHEASAEHRFVVVVLVVDRHAVVSAELEAAFLVRQTERVVGIELVGVDGFFKVVNGIALGKAFAEIADKEFFRSTPIGLAVLEGIGVTMILVGEVIEADVDRLSTKCGDRRREPVVASYNLQGGNA